MRAVELAAIELAQAYAVANGYDRTDRTAVGLVLAGMAIVAACGPDARDQIREDYRDQHPDAARVLDAWSARLDDAARRL